MANKIYTLPRGTEPTEEVINMLITSKQRKSDIDHYNLLDKYYLNEAVTSRDAPHSLLAITNHARYIVKTNVGYLLGNPVLYSVTEGLSITPVIDLYRKQTIANLDVELESDASIFGHAFERVYVDEEKESRSAKVDPRNIIMVYDDTVKHEKMFAVIYSAAIDSEGAIIKDQFDLTILTASTIQERTLKGSKLLLASDDEDRVHAYGEVPVIEYLNSSDRMGDFEPVVPLIDAYNILQSDRIIDRERLVDAILAFYGMDFTPEQQQELKESRILANMPADGKAEYIVKSIDEADADVLRKTLASDIHKISMTPDMSDENFAGNSSGVALMFKLLPFENHIKDKERYFETGLMSRFRVYNKFLSIVSNMPIVPVEDVDAIFKRALPQNDLEISQMINNLHGIVDKELLVSQLSFVRDAKETIELAAKEAKVTSVDPDLAAGEITDQNETNDNPLEA